MEYNSFTDSFNGPSAASNLAPSEGRPQGPAYQVGRGGTEVTYDRDDSTGQTTAGSTRTSSGVTVRADDLAQGEGMERTIRTSSGWPVLGRGYRGDDTIEVEGQRFSLSIAAQLGLAQRNPDGSFSLVAQAQQMQAQQMQAQLPQETAPFTASPDAEAAMEALTQHVAPSMQMAALNTFVETGQVGPEMIERIARQSGAEPGEIAEAIEAVHEGFYDAVIGRVGNLGVHDDDLFVEFVEGDPQLSRQMKQAVRGLLTENDPSGFDGLASAFVQALDRVDPHAVTDALTAARVPFQKGADGRLVLTLPGAGQVAYAQAVKAGLIKVSRW